MAESACSRHLLPRRGARLKALIERHAGGHAVTVQGCAGVVDHIEAGDLDSQALKTLVQRYCAPLLEAGVDTALLGCTHYPLIEPLWRAALGPGVRLLRIETAVARRAADLWTMQSGDAAGLSVETSGSPEALRAWMARVLDWQDVIVQGWAPAAAGALAQPGS